MRVAIVEDEFEAAETLKSYISRYSRESKLDFDVDTFSDGSDFLDKYRPVYDMVFMDIEMPHMNGMDAAKELRLIDKNVVLIFVTNMTKYAVKGYLVDALGYMVKPVSYFQFSAQMVKAVAHVSARSGKKLFLKLADGLKVVQTNEILYIESIGHKLVYHTLMGNLEVYGTMSETEKSLKEACGECYPFYSCHRSIFVNMNFITSIDKNGVTVGGDLLPVSRLKYKEFLDSFCLFMSRNNSGGGIL